MLVVGFRKDSEKYNNISKDQKLSIGEIDPKKSVIVAWRPLFETFYYFLCIKLKFYEINLCFSCVGGSGRNWWGSSLITILCYWDRFPAIKLCRLAILFFCIQK